MAEELLDEADEAVAVAEELRDVSEELLDKADEDVALFQ